MRQTIALAAMMLGIAQLVLPPAAHAQSAASPWEGSITVPGRGFFLGFGLGVGATNFGHQSLYAIGTSRNYTNGALTSAGTAAGPGSADLGTAGSPMPEVRLGYYAHFSNSPWLWGFRVSYQDLLAERSESNLGIPQMGVNVSVSPYSVTPFTGVAVVQSYRVQADSRLGAMPFIGRDIGRGFVYLGLGGVMTHATTQLNGLVGYANYNGQDVNVSGAPQNFSSAGWVLGAGFTIGGTYFVTHDWFLDIAYSFDETAAQIGRYFSTFSNSATNPGTTTQGNLIGQSSERIITNSVTVTVNRRF